MTALLGQVGNYFNLTALLFGAVVVTMQVVNKKAFAQVFAAGIKSIIGFIIFNTGVSVFLNSANNMRLLAEKAFDISAPANTNIYFQTQGIYYIPVVIFSFLLHLLIERYLVPEKMRYVNMSGCHVLIRVSLLTTGVAVVVYGQTNWLVVVLFGTIISAAWYCIQPLYVRSITKQIRGDEMGGYGHQTSISLVITGFVTKLLVRKRRENDDTESVKIPKALVFLRDMGVCMFSLQTITMIIFSLLCGMDVVRELSGEMHPWMWIIAQGLCFAGGYFILTNGLQMITSELVPSLSAISMKILPGTRMAMDIPTFFPYGQNAVLFGALAGSTVFITLLFVFASLGWGFIGGATLYFYMVAGGSAIYGNKIGGRKGAIIGGVVTALLMAFGSLLIQKLGGAFYEMEYFCNVASEPDDRFILYPIAILFGRLLFGERDVPFGL